MTQKLIISLISILSVLVSNEARCTAQFGDRLIYNNDTVVIFSNPLEQYFEKKTKRRINGQEMEGECTALWRGYVATWTIENDSLFLIRIQTNYCHENKIDLDIEGEFKTQRVFANWFTGEINSQLGSMLSYMHAGYGTLFETEQNFKIKQGIILSIDEVNYIEYTKGRLHPGIDFLTDTIKRIIYNNLDLKYLKVISNNEICQIIISFNYSGELERISAVIGEDDSPNLTSVILHTANLALKDFPKLMKVNHKRYSPPIIRIWFHAHCLKHPEDEKYGCDDYRKLIDPKEKRINEKQNETVFNYKWLYIFLGIIVISSILLIFRKKK